MIEFYTKTHDLRMGKRRSGAIGLIPVTLPPGRGKLTAY
jgi:hypothetical protein